MAFKAKLLNLVKKQIQGWHLPDQILDEVSLFLIRVLPADIEHNLMRLDQRLHSDIAELADNLYDKPLEIVGRNCPAYEILCHEQSQLYTRIFQP